MPPTTPQKMSSADFAKSIKQKYPAYSNVDDNTLVQKMIAKYPVYKDRVNLETLAETPPTSQTNINYGMGLGMGTGVAPLDFSDPVASFAKNVWSSVKAQFKEATNTFSDYLTKPNPTVGDVMTTSANVAKNVTGIVASPIMEAYNEVLSPVIQPIADVLGNTPEVQAFTEFMSKYPKISGVLSDLIQTGGNVAALTTAPEVTKTTAEAVSKVPEKISSVKSRVTTPPKTDLEIINEKISPKPTTKEVKLAQKQGRLYSGQEPSLFKQGQGGKIATSNQTYEATLTVNKLIPDAAKMDNPSLYLATKEKISEIGTKLKPKLESVPIKPETIEKINSANKTIGKQLVEEAPATEESNVIKRQAQFEEYLKKSGSDNLNDLWETLKAYDDSIKDNVKEANSLSSDSLQQQKAEWISRRNILSEIIKDTETTLDPSIRGDFADMRNLYEAQRGLRSQAKLDQPQPSKTSQFLQTVPGKVIKAGLKGAGLGAGIHFIP